MLEYDIIHIIGCKKLFKGFGMAKQRREGFPDSVPEFTPWNDKDGAMFERLFIHLLDEKFQTLISFPEIMNYLKERNLVETDEKGHVLRVDYLSERFERTFGVISE